MWGKSLSQESPFSGGIHSPRAYNLVIFLSSVNAFTNNSS